MYAYSVRFFASAPRRLFLLGVIVIALGVNTLSADVLTPFTTTSCSENGIAGPCPFGFPPPPTGVGVFDTIVALGTPGIDVLVGASAGTDSMAGLNQASAAISTDFFATTAGPVRPGSMTYALTSDGNAGAGGGFAADASIPGIGFCSGMGCHKTGTIPFTLGVPFEIKINASGSGDFFHDFVDTGGLGHAEVVINLFDSAGNPVTILAPVTTPEPAHSGLAVAALFGSVILLRKRR
jgi:hypothetical protein